MKSPLILTTLRLIAAAVLIASGLAFTAFADTIRLKDGSIIKGKIVSFENGRFKVVIGEGERRRELSYDVSEVESIIFDDQRPSLLTQQSQINPVPTPSVRVVVSENIPVTPTPGAAAKSTDQAAASNPNPSRKPDLTAQPKSESTAKPVGQAAAKIIEPITVKVNVLADNTYNGWTNSGWVVRKGQKIKITGSGEIDLGGGRKCPPGGLPDLEDKDKLLKAVPTGALIAVIGDDNNDFIYIGDEREFIAARDGALFLGVNEGNIDDNAGMFEAVIQIWPK